MRRLPGQAAGPPVGLEANRAPIVVARLNADAAVWRFKAEVMAHVRSIEQQYWSLAQQHVQLWSSEKAVELAHEIVNREQAELVVGRGTVADVAEAAAAAGTVQPRPGYQDFRRDHHRTTVAQHPRLASRRQPAHHSGDAADRGSSGARLGIQPGTNGQRFSRTSSSSRSWSGLPRLQLLVARNQLLPQLNLNALYQFNGLGQQLDNAEAVMTGATIKALEPGHRQPGDARPA